MKGLVRCVLLISVFFWGRSVGVSQESLLSMNSLVTTVNGLPEKCITHMAIDKFGFMWIATPSGIARWDGHHMETWDGRSTPALMSSYVNFILPIEDEIWVGTNKGINLININQFEFKTIPLVNGIQVNKICYDSISKNVVVLCEKNKLIINPHRKDARSINLGQYTIIKMEMLDSHHLVYMDTYGSVFQVELNNFSSELLHGQENRFPDTNFSIGGNDQIFVTNDVGLGVIDLKTGKELSLLTGYPSVNWVTADPYHQCLWFITNHKNLYRMDLQTKQVDKVLDRQELFPVLRQVVVNDKGLVLVTSFSGLLKVVFQSEAVRDLDENVLNSESVLVRRAVAESPKGERYFFAYKEFFKKDSDQLVLQDMHANIAYCVFPLDEHRILVGTEGKGLYMWKPEEKKLDFMASDQTGELNKDMIRCIVKKGENEFLLGQKNGLFHFDLKTNRTSRFFLKSNDQPEVFDIALDQEGRYLIATNNGLYILGKQLQVLGHLYPSERELKMFGEVFYDVFQAKSGKIYLGCDNGMLVLNRSFAFEHFFGRESLIGSTHVVHIEEDVYQRIWIATFDGLVCYDPSSSIGRRFTMKDGLKSNEFNRGQHLNSKDGHIYFPSFLSFVDVSPSVFKLEDDYGSIHVTKMVFRGEMNEVKRVVMSEQFNSNQGIQMYQDERALHLDFSLLDFANADFVTYGYRILDGVDSNLVDLGNNPHFVLNNLPEGRYRLEIVAFGDRGPISGSRMIIPLIVQIPFYEKKVFWILVVGLFIFLLGALYVERLNRIQNLNVIRANIAADLHDDVGSILTKTAMDAELLYIQSDSSSPRLKSIAVNCRMALQGLRDLSWSLGQENTDGIHIKDRVNQFLLDIVKNTEITFKIDSSETFNKRQFTLLERRQISMLIKESVTNAMKYSNLTHIYLHMDQKENKVAIRMENDGYQESERMAGMGMANMRKRIKSLNGEMNVKILGDIYTIEFYYS